jgi:hypothetical protein
MEGQPIQLAESRLLLQAMQGGDRFHAVLLHDAPAPCHFPAPQDGNAPVTFMIRTRDSKDVLRHVPVPAWLLQTVASDGLPTRAWVRVPCPSHAPSPSDDRRAISCTSSGGSGRPV